MPATPKSASKKRTGRSKSPARSTKSRSRSRGRSKSPARQQRTTSKSPSRRSPGRKAKEVEPVAQVAEVKDVKQTSTRVSRKEASEAAEVTVSKTTTTRQTTAVLRPAMSTPQRQSARIANMNSHKDYTDSNSKASESKQNSTRSKKTQKKEFAMGGPVATFMMTLLFPATVYLLNYACNKKSCSVENIMDIKNLFPRTLNAYFDKESFLMFIGFNVYFTVLCCLPVGKVVYGPPVKGGVRLQYRLNGFFSLIATMATFASMWYFGCGVRMIYDKFYQLMAISTLYSFVLSFALYVRAAKATSAQLADSGNTGCVTHDFFMGRELNPRVGSLDLKLKLARIGVIGATVISLAFLAVSYEQTKKVDYTLFASFVFHTMYNAYALYFEEAWLQSMDFTLHGLGFMFTFSMSTMVPFLYTLVLRYLLEHPQNWSPLALSAFTFFHLAGYIIFVGSNVQKMNFRKNPNDPAFANMETIPTSGGKKLLVSGWWGLVRHPNYLGDLIMAFTWASMCGCAAHMPYFYPLFLTLILFDRSVADGKWCKEKHGAAWDRYCQRVPYQIIPRVF